ncbi:MAG: 4Fe-4S binding protein [Planctomycetota bacterium]|nr:4Fe-4S binding protein [Planctomycetota bacterium]
MVFGKCPGQDTQYWKPEDIYDVACPGCGSPVEFWKTDVYRSCRKCGARFANPRLNMGCAQWCAYAPVCLGPDVTKAFAELKKERAGTDATTRKEENAMAKQIKRKIIKIDEKKCDGCGLCVPACAEGAIAIVDGKARLVSQKYCDGLGACLGECPRGALTVEEREAAPFDEAAVKEHLTAREPKKELPCGCPAARVMRLDPAETHAGASALAHWPVKLQLVPPGAPFLKGADVLLAADCGPVASGRFHHDYLKGRAVILACPKFADFEAHKEKLTEILTTARPASLTVLRMEVPCCGGLVKMAEDAIREAGTKTPLSVITLALNGDEKERKNA